MLVNPRSSIVREHGFRGVLCRIMGMRACGAESRATVQI